MSKTTIPFDCSGVNNILMQKRARALIHIPPSRFTMDTPYPRFTQSQLDMRRKVEILKYNGNKQNTKTNSLTKKEQFALLSKGKSSYKTSQYTISHNTTTTMCASDLTKPTLTSSCNVPGPLMYLQYDPDVPLYNYSLARTFGTEPTTDTSLWNAYTNNILAFFESNTNNATADIPNILRTNIYKISSGSNLITLNNISDITVGASIFATGIPTGTTIQSFGNNNTIIKISNKTTTDISSGTTIRFRNMSSQTMIRTFPLGSILITDLMISNRYSFNMSIPLGIWVQGIYGYGTQDQYGNTITSTGTLVSSDIIKISITNIIITITYNGIEIMNTGVNISHTNTQSLTIQGIDIQKGTFYGIQYVGFVNISGLNLQTQPGNLYNITMTVSYTYDTDISSKFDIFQTGIFPNIQEDDKNISNFKFNSTPYPIYSSSFFTPYLNSNG
jgi:hypothetical protein